MIVGPLLLGAVLSGTALGATTGIAAGLLLLGTASAGFHDLAGPRAKLLPEDLAPTTVGSCAS